MRDLRVVSGSLLALSLVLNGAPSAAQEAASSVTLRSRDAYEQPFPALPEAARELFLNGQGIFNRSWVVSPSQDAAFDGLGPLHSRLACVSCHPRNGRGLAPERPEQRLRSMLIRLSVPGQDAHGGPLPHPVYGDQLNEEAIPGVPGEGRASLHWEEHPYQFADGGQVTLRRPVVAFNALAYGSLNGVEASTRVGPLVVGLGLLEAVPESALRELAAAAKPDGVRGILNEVYDPVSGQRQVGRFGYKASVASVYGQSAKAMLGDLGISSTLYPTQNCSSTQTACLAASSGGSPEITDTQLEALEFYLRHVAVPARRDTEQTSVQAGEGLFTQLGCSHCHVASLPMPADYPYASSIAAYTDLLVHDMGEELADGGTEYRATAAYWRTTPLWGIGLSAAISGSAQYLHDGRARTLTEAILWHGGEAQVVKERFAGLSEAERDALLAFLQSL